MGETRRLFLALWPAKPVREALGALARRVAETVDGRLVPEENLHLTLAFLGHVPGGRQAALETALRGLSFAAFVLRLDRLGYWPRPRVVWVGKREAPVALGHLVAGLREVLADLALPVEQRPFVPHVTLLRKVRRRPSPVAFSPIPWPVHDFVLVESHLEPSGARYEILHRWPLGTS